MYRCVTPVTYQEVQHTKPVPTRTALSHLCSSGRVVGMYPMRVRDTDSVFVEVINCNYACNTNFSKTWLCTMHALHRPSKRICLVSSQQLFSIQPQDNAIPANDGTQNNSTMFLVKNSLSDLPS